jgi:hypothetical protein
MKPVFTVLLLVASAGLLRERYTSRARLHGHELFSARDRGLRVTDSRTHPLQSVRLLSLAALAWRLPVAACCSNAAPTNA